MHTCILSIEEEERRLPPVRDFSQNNEVDSKVIILCHPHKCFYTHTHTHTHRILKQKGDNP